ncbi:hypothetical protein, partial [Streptomyces sp. NPDC002547]
DTPPADDTPTVTGRHHTPESITQRAPAECLQCSIKQRLPCLYGQGMDASGQPTLDEIEDWGAPKFPDRDPIGLP